MDKIYVDFTLSTEKPVVKSRLATLREYIELIAKRVGMKITKVEERDG